MRRVRFPGWTASVPEADGSKGGTWTHTASGWLVAHCGHPTAHFPYWLRDPAHPSCETMTHNGRGFTRLVLAIEAVERIVAGELVTTNANCAPGTRVVPGARVVVR